MKETVSKNQELMVGHKQLMDKRIECSILTAKITKVEESKAKQFELLKLTRLNATQMVKEVRDLRSSVVREKHLVAKAETALIRMQGQIEDLQHQV
ncbi:hypothetical protein PoB_006064600 [Plakobranchus ocellatus]|uniref:Uncharacterized protein n=1 Tax=Plakobranchus ocellatus TaxID=259542 RepID=A0AAV4CQR7_9GAST|nr:hypothetical protein PoB_006064600 [Plakobranchus ocellatus]